MSDDGIKSKVRRLDNLSTRLYGRTYHGDTNYPPNVRAMATEAVEAEKAAADVGRWARETLGDPPVLERHWRIAWPRALRTRRAELGLLQADVAHRLGFDRSAYSRTESLRAGRSYFPRWDTIVKIAAALELDAVELVRRADVEARHVARIDAERGAALEDRRGAIR